MRTIERLAGQAGLNRLWTHTVGVVNSIRTEGHDPVTGKKGDTEEFGTGCAARWGDHCFILTAKHVLDKAEPGDLRIFFRPGGSIEFRTKLRKQDIRDATPMSEQNVVIQRCDWEDLALITTDPKAAGPHVEFCDMANDSVDPPEGEIVHCLGFPFDSGQIVEKKMDGDKEERIIALEATPFSGPVLYEDKVEFKIAGFDPKAHYLVPFEEAAKGKHPRGFSGAATWWESDEKQTVWRPNFKFAGVSTSYYKHGSLERVVKASAVRHFLAEVFGPGA